MTPEKDKDFSFKFDGQFKQFCTKACMTLFVLSHRKIVACISCKVSKICITFTNFILVYILYCIVFELT